MFERILLIIGLLVIVLGYALLSKAVRIEGFSTQTLIAIFLWLLLLGLIILTSVAENMKEELRTIVENQLEEVRLLRQDLKKH